MAGQRWFATLVILSGAVLVSHSKIWHLPAREPAIRVTMAGGCPGSVARYSDVSNPKGGSSKEVLVPPHPQRGLICRYGPLFLAGGETAPNLYRSTVLNGSEASRLARVIDEVSTAPPTGVAACPADANSATIIVFGYAARPDVDLWYHDSGCQTLDNSEIGAYEEGNPSFYRGFLSAVDALSP